jgi:hypothetical protein
LYTLYGAAYGYPGADLLLVDGDNGNDSTGVVNDASKPYKSIQGAVTAARNASSINGTVFILPKAMAAGASDPSNYAETVIVPAGLSGLRLIGCGGGPVQGGQPQMKIGGSSTTAMLTLRAPGCVVAGITFNGASSTGGGILLDDDGSTKSAFGTTIANCMFKNCKGHATNGKLGGAIYWPAAGGAWQVLIAGCNFYSNVCGVCLVGTSGSRPKDIKIVGNIFGADAATAVDAYIYGAGGSGFNDVTIANNMFTTVLPNNTSGTIHRYLDLTGVASGVVAVNQFGSNGGAFGATGDSGLIPTTVGICGNYQDGALIART